VTRDRRAGLKALLETDPTDAFTRYALALEHAAPGATETAIRELARLHDIAPEYVPAYHQRGVLHERAGDTDEARTAYQQGIAVARRTGDDHAAREMQDALDALS